MPWPYEGPPPLTPQQVKALKKAPWGLINPLGPPVLFNNDSGGGMTITAGSITVVLTPTEASDLRAGVSLLSEYSPQAPGGQ